MSDLTKLVPKPAAGSINSGLSPAHQATMLRLFGAPSNHPSEEDGPVTNAKLRAAIVTESVGPFRVTGHRQAIASLREILAEVKARRPDLYAALGTAGMLCCRLVRGSKTSWSNHAWGFAFDVLVEGVLDKRGDDKVLQGTLDPYGFFHRHRWYWGAEFSIEDAMHFEPSDELLSDWRAKGLV